MTTQRIKLTLALAAALLAGHSAAQEEEKRTTQAEASADLPDGFAVLERYVEALGGLEAHEKMTGVKMTGRFAMPAMGIGGTIDMNMAMPNKRVMLINVEGFGVIEQGTDGKVAWSTQMPGTPPTMLEGEDAQKQIEDADFLSRVKPREQYASAETVGVFTHKDQKVYKVKLVDQNGDHSEGLYEVESGLLVKQSAKAEPEAPGFATETEFSDYREISGGVKMAYSMVVTANQSQQTITFDQITINPEFLDDTFDPPGAL